MYAGSFLPPISCCTFPDSFSSDISSPSKRPHIPLLPPPPLLHLLIRYSHSGGQIGGGWLRGPWASPIFGSLKVSAFFPNTQLRTMSWWNPCANLMHFLRLPYSHLTHYYFKSIELGFWFLIFARAIRPHIQRSTQYRNIYVGIWCVLIPKLQTF